MAQSDTTTFHIRYVAADNVYITGGRNQGVSIGDELAVWRDDVQIARIRVTYAASGSASCKVEAQSQPIAVGDRVTWLKRVEAKPDTPPPNPPRTRRRRSAPLPDAQGATAPTVGPRLKGSLSLSYDQFEETQSQTSFTQPSGYLKFRIMDPVGQGSEFRFRYRTRMNRRNYRFSDAPEVEWRSRLYEVSLANAESAAFHFQAGRILSRAFSGVGYIDGLQLQRRVSGGFSLGAFGGVQPQWQFTETSPTVQKFGAYLKYQSLQSRSAGMTLTLAGVGEYQGSTISREFVYLQTTINGPHGWSLYQSLELDVNRQWRRDRAGEALSLTGLYLSGRARLTSGLSVNLSLDNRKNYYTHVWVSLADSLFDSAFRRGARLALNWRFTRHLSLSANVGLRRTEGTDQQTRSLSGNLMVRNWPWRGLLTTAHYASLENPYTTGQYAVFRLGQNFGGGHGIYLDFGDNRYNYTASGLDRVNKWLRLELQLIPMRSLFFNLSGELDWGDDLESRRLSADLGLRF